MTRGQEEAGIADNTGSGQQPSSQQLSHLSSQHSPSFLKRTIFTYAIEHLQQKDKVRFYYALKGRDGKSGFIKQYAVEQLGRAVLLVPRDYEKEADEFLQLWKCEYQKQRVLVEP